MELSKLELVKINSAPLVCIYGSPGIGKTAFAIGTEAPDFKVGKNNHLLMNLDYRGADRLDCVRMFDKQINCIEDIKKNGFNASEKIKEGFDALTIQNHGFNWIVVDDLSTLEEIFVAEVCYDYKVDEIKKIEYGRGYELAKIKWFAFFDMIRKLQDAKAIGVLLIGHTRVESVKDPMSETYSRHDLQLDKRSKDIIKKSVDLIGFARKKVLTKVQEQGFKKENIPVGDSQRVLTFAPDLEGFDSKDRFGLPGEIPLDWNIFETELLKTFQKKN